jgi:hypothetical protein
MSETGRRGCSRILGNLTLAAVRADRAFMLGRERGRSFLRGLATEALTADELENVMVRFYTRGPRRFSGSALKDWESLMLDRWLPKPPARVLVTAAGSGREARALIARGYAVDALEPVPGMAAACAAVPGIGVVVQATHEDLARAVGGGGGPAAPLSDRRYDAVLVGWGSFPHVLSRDGQLRLLATCDRLTPSGPILLSFFARVRTPDERLRAFGAGVSVGRRLAASRGGMPKEFDIGFAWNVGFTHPSTADEIGVLASSLDRVAETVLTPYGHAVLRPTRSRPT